MGIAITATQFKVLVNATNHPSAGWSEDQKNAALKLAEKIVDVPFPNVPPTANQEEVDSIIDNFTDAILTEAEYKLKEVCVHIMGEAVVTHAAVNTLMRDMGIPCFASTTERRAVEVTNADGTTTKNVVFKFCQFRSYFV